MVSGIPDLSVAILAGGRSSRFGSDKAEFQIEPDGPSMLQLVVDAGRQLSDDVFVVGHPRYAALVPEVPVVVDEIPDSGPLRAIATALRVSERSRTLVVACDMPCLSTPLLRWMCEIPTEADVVVPQTAEGRFHPLHAIYRANALPQIDVVLSRDRHAVTDFLGTARLEIIDESALRAIDPNLDSLFSVNHPHDSARASKCLHSLLLTRSDARLADFG